mmetsp:Transcript_2633/g.6160  ORF Transcript_2633/g.6160 Transcript_2633/m.6160 type:complete len:85 (-) Transcript_2633:178-432(-)
MSRYLSIPHGKTLAEDDAGWLQRWFSQRRSSSGRGPRGSKGCTGQAARKESSSRGPLAAGEPSVDRSSRLTGQSDYGSFNQFFE